MTKLIYNGVMATGSYKSQNFEQTVKKGETYDVPKSDVEECLRSGDWKRPETIEKETKKWIKETKKEIKEIVSNDEEVSDTKESTDGGNKKW